MRQNQNRKSHSTILARWRNCTRSARVSDLPVRFNASFHDISTFPKINRFQPLICCCFASRRDASVLRGRQADGQQGTEQSFSSVAHNQPVFSGSQRLSLWCNLRRNSTIRTFRSFPGDSGRHRPVGQFECQHHSSVCSQRSM
jgi:hypothetical protein